MVCKCPRRRKLSDYRFVSAFAEVGASYYFDNGSEIETIHSEKPFNMSLQFGFRFGF